MKMFFKIQVWRVDQIRWELHSKVWKFGHNNFQTKKT